MPHRIYQDKSPSRNFANGGGSRVTRYCLGTDESVTSATDEEPPAYEEGSSVFCDDRLSEGTRVREEEEEIG